MISLINWGLFVVGMFCGIGLTMMMYVVIWQQIQDMGKKNETK